MQLLLNLKNVKAAVSVTSALLPLSPLPPYVSVLPSTPSKLKHNSHELLHNRNKPVVPPQANTKKMCEWLASNDWFDVQLLCGGRTFSAHRAVLASVSDFLRRVLLSCPVDESPVCIYLPEFDHDAMPSVLCYIYTGEVLVPRYKLKMFLDIVKEMEIYIDQQCIPEMNDFVQYCKTKEIGENTTVKQYNMYQLKLREHQSKHCVNIKNGMSIENLLCQLQKSLSNLNVYDNPPRCRQTYENVSDLGGLITQSGVRQRHSFLRDIFIETYSQNGNGNGLSAGVLAISNEPYRAPTSVLLTNANGKHPSAIDLLSNTSESTPRQSSEITSIFDSFKQVQYIPNLEINYNEQNCCKVPVNYKSNPKVCNLNFNCNLRNYLENLSEIKTLKTNIPSELSSKLRPLESLSNVSLERHCTSLNLSHTKETSDFKSLADDGKRCELPVLKNSCSNLGKGIFENNCLIEDENGTHSGSGRTIAKVIILNEVLQCPWRPCQPTNYKPFRKKLRSSIYDSQRNYESKSNAEDLHDKNNNKNNNRSLQLAIDVNDDVSSIQCVHKCTLCHQVFPSSESYEVHRRQHVSINRYSCGECHKTFSQLRNFKYHMSVHRGTKEFATTCTVCGKHFNDRGYLSSHMKIHRNRKEYKCGSCPKSFNQRVAYNMHVRIHTGVKPHVCEECGKAFSRKMLLKQHQRTHSGERPYACAHCDKRFADRSNMTLHLRLHTGVKPFSCNLCPKSFTKKHHLKAHLNFHTGAKPYSCPRCHLAFTQSSNMRTHYKKCNAPVPTSNSS